MRADIPQARPPLTTWGMLLVIVGLLLLVPAGLCTAGALVVGIVGHIVTGDSERTLVLKGFGLIVGGIPTALGALMLFLGLRLRKPI